MDSNGVDDSDSLDGWVFLARRFINEGKYTEADEAYRAGKKTAL